MKIEIQWQSDVEQATHDREQTRKALGQYFTPRWVAEAIVERHFADLQAGHTVIEPSCGDGRFLHALPRDVRAIGVEIDPVMAQRARTATGREVIEGDFCRVALPCADGTVEAVVGNPPFQAETVAGFLDRTHALLREGGRCGLILPAYVMQTSSKVIEMSRRWSISQELMPRNIFPRLSMPIIFALFTKDQRRQLFGFYLYREAADVAAMDREARMILEQGAEASANEAVYDLARGSVWRQALHHAFDLLDADTAPLTALYEALAARNRRPTDNAHYAAKLRQCLQQYPEFEPVERGCWRRVAAPAWRQAA